MRKLITLTLAVLMAGLFAAVVFAAVEAGDDPSTTVGTTETSPTTTTDTTDTTDTTETTTTPQRERPAEVDISGPCDEAEHAGDPRCQSGVAPRLDDDRRGGDDDFEDHSGPGRGDDDDHSGSGHGGDDDFDDHSGRGHGGDDDDNSGSGRGGGD